VNPLLIILPSVLFAIPFTVEAGSVPETVDSDFSTSHFRMHPEFEQVIRGQTPQTFDLGPGSQQQQVAPFDPNLQSQPGANIYGGSQPAPLGYDPFNPQPGGAAAPYGAPQSYGVVGPQPIKYGRTTRFDFVYIDDADLQAGPAGVQGDLNVFEYSLQVDNVNQAFNGWTIKHSPQFKYSQYDYTNIEASRLPLATANGTADISDNYYQIGYRFETTSPQVGPASYRFGVTPTLATDFEQNLNSSAWNFDVDITGLYRVSPTLMLVAGVLYWERAEDHILPTGGVVWTPNQFWEIRATYPKARADVFIGTPFGVATWLYAGAEYQIDSWQAGEISGQRPQLQVEEWRTFTGIRWDHCSWQSYVDFGYVFDREHSVHGLSTVVPLDPGEAFMIRAGLTY